MTTEPPRGIKANLQRSYQNIVTVDTYNELRFGLQENISRLSEFGDIVRLSELGDVETASQPDNVANKSPSPTASMTEGPFIDARNSVAAAPNPEQE